MLFSSQSSDQLNAFSTSALDSSVSNSTALALSTASSGFADPLQFNGSRLGSSASSLAATTELTPFTASSVSSNSVFDAVNNVSVLERDSLLSNNFRFDWDVFEGDSPLAENLYLVGDQPSFGNTQVGLSNNFTVNDGSWSGQNLYPRQVADVNGDGRADIIGFGRDNVYVSLGNSNGTFSNAQVGLSNNFTVNDGSWSGQDLYPRQVADVNGDGRADIIGFGRDNVYVSLGNSNGTFSNAQVGLSNNFTVNDGSWSGQNLYPRQVADVNGDGRADIIGFGRDNVYVSLGNSNGTFSNAQVGLSNNFTVNDGSWSGQNLYPRQVADVNGDGRADIIGFGRDNVYVSLGNSNGTFSNAQVGLSNNFTVNDGSWSGQDLYPRQVADVNGDGRADIIGFGRDNVFIALGNSNGTFSNAQVGLSNNFTVNDGSWSSQDLYPRQVADVNGDGRADIIGFGRDNVYVSLGIVANRNDYLVGGAGNDTIEGLTGNDTLSGGAGNDTLKGSYGDDVLSGGSGQDFLYGDDGNDTLYGEAGNDVLYGGNGYDIIFGGNDNDILYGENGNDALYGEDGGDYLEGGLGSDTLNGGAGNDILNGTSYSVTNSYQVDYLTGGYGSDTFVLGNEGNKVYYSQPNDGYAVIQDWHPINTADSDIDRIQLYGNASQYKVEYTNVGGMGTAAQDTQIFFNSNNTWELIGVIQDSTNFSLNRDALYVGDIIIL